MQPDRPLLTIAIPTYNRSSLLDGILAQLHEQLAGENRVELLISDNASTDGTRELIIDYQNRSLPVRYVRNETNLGPDRNILQCFELASGKFVWIFGDDDLIVSGTLKRVLDSLSSKEYDLICIRARFFEGEVAEFKRIEHVPDLEFIRPEDLARHVHVFFTFISGVIVNRNSVSSFPHRSFDALLDTNLVQLGPVYAALNHHCKSLLIRDPLIMARGNGSVGYALFRVFGPKLMRITGEWVESRAVQRAIINGTIQMFFPFFVLLTRLSKTSSVVENPHQVLRPCFGNNFRYWIFDYPIYAMPIPLAKIWLLIVRVMNKVDTLLGGPLVRS